jgi:hypothetical protein
MFEITAEDVETIRALRRCAVRLGDFIGNGEPDCKRPQAIADRCSIVGAAARLLERLDAAAARAAAAEDERLEAGDAPVHGA